MNKTPSILVDTGFEVDANGVLTEIVTPNVVKTLNAPTKITFLGETINYVPSSAAALLEFNAPNVTTVTANLFKNYAQLQSISLSKCTTITSSGSESGLCFSCFGLVNVSLPQLNYISIGTSSYSGSFRGCTSLVNLELPKLISISGGGSTSGAFYQCTNLQSVILGSINNPVTALNAYTFQNCTQSGLTITIYTQGGAALSGAPWGATNATIVYEEA